LGLEPRPKEYHAPSAKAKTMPAAVKIENILSDNPNGVELTRETGGKRCPLFKIDKPP